jgi:simple sugar transport system ATP-binding protein
LIHDDPTSRDPLLKATGISKNFGHVEALRGADFTIFPNEIVALVGDNGAGKSTLVKVLSGEIRPDSGSIEMDGQSVEFASSEHARQAGIEVVYQDLSLAPDLDPAANMFLGREVMRSGFFGKLGALDNRWMRREAESTFRLLGMRIPSLDVPVRSLSGGQQQGIAVCRAAKWANRIMFMDEPTAALGVVQKREVRDLVLRVREAGVSIVYISHNLPEVFEVADRVQVMYLGARIADLPIEHATTERVVAAMTGAIDQTVGGGA